MSTTTTILFNHRHRSWFDSIHSHSHSSQSFASAHCPLNFMNALSSVVFYYDFSRSNGPNICTFIIIRFQSSLAFIPHVPYTVHPKVRHHAIFSYLLASSYALCLVTFIHTLLFLGLFNCVRLARGDASHLPLYLHLPDLGSCHIVHHHRLCALAFAFTFLLQSSLGELFQHR